MDNRSAGSRRVAEVMTHDSDIVAPEDSVSSAAERMRDRDVGNVIVAGDAGVVGILTDRDIVVRVVADGKDPHRSQVGEVCSSKGQKTLSPDDELDTAVSLMRDNAVRRLPVVDGDRVVGVVSIGDLAIERDPASALAGVSAASPNR